MSTVRQFIWERLFESTNYILEVVKLNNIQLFNMPHKRQRTNTSGLVSSLITEKSECNLFSRLHVASQSRDGNLNEFVSHENQPCPPSLSVRGNLKLGTKSDIVRCLEDAPEEQDDTSVDVVGVRRTSHLVHAETCSRWNFLRIICPLCVPTICITSIG